MLFHSYIFLLGFLPIALGLYWFADTYKPAVRLPILLALSLAFYGWWDWRFLPLLMIGIISNWLLAEIVFSQRNKQNIALFSQNNLIIIGIFLNLSLLVLFKYVDFLNDLFSNLTHQSFSHLDLILPLGVSFFTFHHIMYLVDLKRGHAPRMDLVRYGLYISFFPQVLAGPLVRWREILHQFDVRPCLQPDIYTRLAQGMALFILGLSKKVFLGDAFGDYVNPVFQQAVSGQMVTIKEAWQATLGFGFQVYFDFSGYTDMALGLGLLFGIVLPQNFDAPYRATSLQDFWRRWHMTLSRFLRDYLYIPLGGNRKGVVLQCLALLVTMTLGGLWHGAGLNFVLWGLLHGLGLVVVVLWQKTNVQLPKIIAWCLTFSFVTLVWVLFRAPTFEAATLVYKGLFGQAALGHEFKWRALVIGAGFACLGPTSWQIVQKLKPTLGSACLLAVLVTGILLKIGDESGFDFIYFQF